MIKNAHFKLQFELLSRSGSPFFFHSCTRQMEISFLSPQYFYNKWLPNILDTGYWILDCIFVEKSNMKMIFCTFHWPKVVHLLVHNMDIMHINFDNMIALCTGQIQKKIACKSIDDVFDWKWLPFSCPAFTFGPPLSLLNGNEFKLHLQCFILHTEIADLNDIPQILKQQTER